MYDELLVEIESPDIVVEFTQQTSALVEIESNKTVIEFESGNSNIIEVDSPSLLIDVKTVEPKSIEFDKPKIIIEFPSEIIINNPDPTPPTEESQSITDSYEAGDQIWKGRVVYLGGDGRIRHADKDAIIDFNDVIGFTKNNGSIGQIIEVVKFGKLPLANFSSLSATYWLGNSGNVLTSAPLSGTLLKVGTQVKADEVFVKIGQPMRRA